MSRAEAARLAGMERQALRGAVVRYNAEGLDGLHDRLRSGRKPRLTEAERTALAKLVTDGPDVEATGLSAWTLADLCAEMTRRWSKTLHPASLSRVVRTLGFSRQKARQVDPQSDEDAHGAFQTGAPGGGRCRACSPSRQAPDAMVLRTKLASARKGAPVPLVDARAATARLVRPALHLGAHAGRGAAGDRGGFLPRHAGDLDRGDEHLPRRFQRHACGR